MLKAEFIIYLFLYINISCICYNNTTNRLKSDQHLLGLTLRVYTWLWNWAQGSQTDAMTTYIGMEEIRVCLDAKYELFHFLMNW